MKKVITHGVMEEANYFCDKHPERECYSHLKTAGWYGSQFDMCGMEIHLCDDCLAEVHTFLKNKFGIDPTDLDI